MKNIIISLFPGIDLLGMGFEEEGYTVLRGPDPLFGGDIRRFTIPRGATEGIIGGPPCQDYSKARRGKPSGIGDVMMGHYHRCVTQAQPDWFLLENVPAAPWMLVDGYHLQRLHVRASEFGAAQHRLRVFQFGYKEGRPLVLPRPVARPVATERAAMASEGSSSNRRGWAEFCQLQGLATALELDSFTLAGKYEAVGNGVHRAVAIALAKAIRSRHVNTAATCWCECGRPVEGRQFATAACRKRAQRERDAMRDGKPRNVTCDRAGITHIRTVTRDAAAVTVPGTVTEGPPPTRQLDLHEVIAAQHP